MLGPISVSRANKAGDRIRRWEASGSVLHHPDYLRELDVLGAWRQQFQIPMNKTATGLRSAYRTATGEGAQGLVIERLKRENQIVKKLVRDRTRLSRMEDIGGCRAVMPDLKTVQLVADKLRAGGRRISVLSEDDYVATPRPGGYRALHLHCARDDIAVEVQLRTTRQHVWAEAVEAWDATFKDDLKHEDAPEPVVESFRSLSERLMQLDASGQPIDYRGVNTTDPLGLIITWIGGTHVFG